MSAKHILVKCVKTFIVSNLVTSHFGLKEEHEASNFSFDTCELIEDCFGTRKLGRVSALLYQLLCFNPVAQTLHQHNTQTLS